MGESTEATLCPECGPDVDVDWEGCCVTCGATSTGAGVREALQLRTRLAAMTERAETAEADAGGHALVRIAQSLGLDWEASAADETADAVIERVRGLTSDRDEACAQLQRICDIGERAGLDPAGYSEGPDGYLRAAIAERDAMTSRADEAERMLKQSRADFRTVRHMIDEHEQMRRERNALREQVADRDALIARVRFEIHKRWSEIGSDIMGAGDSPDEYEDGEMAGLKFAASLFDATPDGAADRLRAEGADDMRDIASNIVLDKIESYGGGDRPMSPPAVLLWLDGEIREAGNPFRADGADSDDDTSKGGDDGRS